MRISVGVVAACATLQPAGLSAQETGSVTGTIGGTGKSLPTIRVTIDPNTCGTELADESMVLDPRGHLANVVVTLVGVKARPNAAEITVTNEGCRFTPRVQVVRPNAVMHTISKDPMLHTTQVLLDNGTTLFNLALPAPGINLARPLGRAGVLRVACNIHQWMRGWIIVTDDVAAVTSTDGRFTLANVPPGTYELKVWHESLKAAPQRVTVAAGKTADVVVHMK